MVPDKDKHQAQSCVSGPSLRYDLLSINYRGNHSYKKVSEYDQKMPQSHTAEPFMAL